METTNTSSKKMKITGWVLSILAILLLLADGFGKLIKPEPVVKATLELGYPESTITTIGILVIICCNYLCHSKISFNWRNIINRFSWWSNSNTFSDQQPSIQSHIVSCICSFIYMAGIIFKKCFAKKTIAKQLM